MQYRYLSLDKAGKKHRGLIEARDEEAALRLLSTRGEVALHLATVRSRFRRPEMAEISRDQIATFLADLAALYEAGVPLRKALDVLAGEASTPRVARLSRLMAERLESGSEIGRAALMQDSKDLTFAAEMIRAGEAAGQLATSLRFSADLLKRQSEFMRRVYGALAYPAFLLAGSICAIIALAVFAGPAIGPLIAETAEPSAALIALLGIGEWLRRYGVILLLALIALSILAIGASAKPPLRDTLAEIRARAPLLGSIVRDLNCGAFARILGAMLAGGVSAALAFRLAANAAPNMAWRKRFFRASDALQEGRSIAAALGVLPSPSPELIRLARIGEESGTAGEMLGRAGTLAAERALRRLDRFAAILGPALILAIGGFIGWLMSVFLGGLSQLGDGIV